MSLSLGVIASTLSKAKGVWQSVILFRDGFPRLLRSLGMTRVSELNDIACWEAFQSVKEPPNRQNIDLNIMIHTVGDGFPVPYAIS